MAYPIRFKLVRKDTDESYGQWAARTRGTSAGLMPFLNGDGNVGEVDSQDFYQSTTFFSPAEWRLLVATGKGPDGKWDYQQVGH